MTATLNSGFPFESNNSFLGTPSFTYSKLTVTQSSDPNATVGENIDFYGFAHATALTYSEFGLWALNSSNLNNSSAYIGTYGGALVPTAAGSVPTTGSANYEGVAVGSIQNMPEDRLSQVAGFSGNLLLSANFGTGAVTGGINNIEAYIFGVLKGRVNDIGISATISGVNLTGTTTASATVGSGYDITNAAGNLVGVFAGPVGNEIAGSFYLAGGNNGNSVIGSFGAASGAGPATLTPPPTANFFSEEVTLGGTQPNYTVGGLKTGQFFSYTGALPNGVTGSNDQSVFTIMTAGGTVSGVDTLGDSNQSLGSIPTTNAGLTVNASTDASISAMGDDGVMYLFDQASQLSYATFGGWALTLPNNGAYSGVLAGGKPGVGPTAAASMPTTGTATFSGGAFGTVTQPGGYTVPAGSQASAGNTALWIGGLDLTATWSSNTLNGTITGINAYPVGNSNNVIGTINDINLSSTISGSSVTGTATAASAAGTAFNIAGATGPLQGAFYGPAAAEVAGTFHMTGGTSNVTLIGSFGGKQGAATAQSDRRLKTEVMPAGILLNGLRLYHWRYLGGAHRFTGVMAQDLAVDPRFAGAVMVDGDGLMRVDYAAIGYIPADLALMQQEGEAASSLYRATLH